MADPNIKTATIKPFISSNPFALNPMFTAELSWPVLAFSSVEEAEGYALELERNLKIIEAKHSPHTLRADAEELEEEASNLLAAIDRESYLCSDAQALRLNALELRARAADLTAIAERRESTIGELEASLEELETLILELKFPLLSVY